MIAESGEKPRLALKKRVELVHASDILRSKWLEMSKSKSLRVDRLLVLGSDWRVRPSSLT